MDYETLYPGRFLKKESLAAPKTIRIIDVTATQLEGEKGVEAKVVIKYKDAAGEGEIVWCKTNAALTAIALNERQYEKWKGRLITIYNNPNVDLAGRKVGGIRVYGSPELTEKKRVEIKRPRRKKAEVYELFPTGKNAAATPTASTPEEAGAGDDDMPIEEAAS